jgi:precorrin-2/cobalt-factor-2 C20-methyltransferase
MRLTGVGVGPGDPDLVTVKAIKVLLHADVVYVPTRDEHACGHAERIVSAHVDAAKVRRLVFALSADRGAREQSWDAAGRVLVNALGAGHHVAFATIGDPNVYSTFTYVAATVRHLAPEVTITTVPGITAVQDLAARSGTVLVEGTQTLALVPLTAGSQQLARALGQHDTVAVYKGGSGLDRVRTLLRDAGRLPEATFGTHLGLDGEQIGTLPDEDAAPYLSTVIVSRPRGDRGAAL